jgi:hypothetical protein
MQKTNPTKKSKLTEAPESAANISRNVYYQIKAILNECGVCGPNVHKIAKSAREEVYAANMRESRELHRRLHGGRELEQG